MKWREVNMSSPADEARREVPTRCGVNSSRHDLCKSKGRERVYETDKAGKTFS